MRCTDTCNNANIRLDSPAHTRYFISRIHAHFKNRGFKGIVYPKHSERNSDKIIIISLSFQSHIFLRKDGMNQLLGSCLPNASRYSNRIFQSVKAFLICHGKSQKCICRILRKYKPAVFYLIRNSVAQSRVCPGFKCPGYIIMSVKLFTVNRYKYLPGSQCP